MYVTNSLYSRIDTQNPTQSSALIKKGRKQHFIIDEISKYLMNI